MKSCTKLFMVSFVRALLSMMTVDVFYSAYYYVIY